MAETVALPCGLPMNENREVPRVRALKGARIVFNRGGSTRDCTIRNLSSRGAKLVLETTVGLPDTFELAFDDGVIRNCVVRWRKLSELGVEFVEQTEIAGGQEA